MRSSSRLVTSRTLRTALWVVVGGAVLFMPRPVAARAPRDGGLYFGVQSASAPPELAVSFEEAAVAVSDVTPGGNVAFFSVARVPRGTYNEVVRRAQIVLADPLGEARFDLEDGEPVPLKSVWAVVDLSSGAYAVAAPEGFHLTEIGFPGHGFEVGAPGLVNRLRQRFNWADSLLARPGVGAWRYRGADGSPDDEDGQANGALVTGLDSYQPLGTSPEPPDRFAADDVLVVVDPLDLRFYATRLLGPPQ